MSFPLPNNVLPANVFIQLTGVPTGNEIPCAVTYAGPAPYLVAGTSQINFKLPNVTGVVQAIVRVPSSSATARILPFQVYIAAP